MIFFLYFIIMLHTVATIVIGYVLREIDEKDYENVESRHFMILVLAIELIAMLSMTSLIIDKWN